MCSGPEGFPLFFLDTPNPGVTLVWRRQQSETHSLRCGTCVITAKTLPWVPRHLQFASYYHFPLLPRLSDFHVRASAWPTSRVKILIIYLVLAKLISIRTDSQTPKTDSVISKFKLPAWMLPFLLVPLTVVGCLTFSIDHLLDSFYAYRPSLQTDQIPTQRGL